MIRVNRRRVGLQPASEISQLGQRSLVVRTGRGPAESQIPLCIAADDTPDGFEDRQTVAVALVEALNIGRQLLAHLTQLPGLGLPGGSVHFTFGLPGFLELTQYVELAALVRMQFEAELSESHFAQAAKDDIQRSDLLGHEEHTFFFSQALRDQVGNSLTLAGTWWSDQHEVFAVGSGHDGGKLG